MTKRPSGRSFIMFKNIPKRPPAPLTGARLRSLAFALLAKREYSQTKLRLKLLELGAVAEELEVLLADLAENNYQSDERMAGMVMRSQIRQGRGPQRIKMALKKHDIDQDFITDDLHDVDWFEEALQLKIKKFGAEVAKEPKEKAKQVRFLQYRGYAMDVVMKVIQYKGEDD